MKKKTAEAILCKVFDDWLESVKDARVAELIKENTIITGGSIASMLLAEKVNDYDIYFKTKEAAYQIAKYYVDRFNGQKPITFPIEGVREDDDRVKIYIKSVGVAKVGKSSKYQYFETVPDQGESAEQYLQETIEMAQATKESSKLPKYSPIFASSNAITLSGKIQLVFRFYGTPEDIHKTYDFVHTTNYWTSWDRKLILNQEALESLLSKELIYLNSQYPICAIIRTRKFINRGWTINAGQYLKMCYAISELDLNNPHVLEDQLSGVDVAYFNQIIQVLKEEKEGNPDFKIEYTYLAKLIDKIF